MDRLQIPTAPTGRRDDATIENQHMEDMEHAKRYLSGMIDLE
jgi:hypothetical protein